LLLGPLLLVEEDAGGDEVQVKGDDHLGPIDEEEGHVPIETVHTRPQASEQGGEFIHPTTSMDLKLIVDTGFDPLKDQLVGMLNMVVRLKVKDQSPIYSDSPGVAEV
jgi:hypothetical protein